MRGILPTELWTEILRALTTNDHRVCLSVSRLLHDISVRFLFSTVRIYFLESKGWNFDDLSDVDGPEARRLIAQSWEILNRIARDTHFAAAVKTLVVHVDKSVYSMIFERCCLVEALAHMRRLNSFRWVGWLHGLPDDVAQALAASCPELHTLEVDSCTPSSVTLLRDGRFSLDKLQFWRQIMDDPEIRSDSDEPMEVIYAPEIVALLDANSSSLRSLSLRADFLWEVPVRVFSPLLHLEISNMLDVGGLELLLHHAVLLESLLMDDIEAGFNDIAATLAQNADTVPRLVSFRMTSRDDRDPGQGSIYAIGQFLQAKTAMRRVDLNFYVNFSAMADILPALKNVTVLGMYMESRNLVEAFAHLQEHLSPQLMALRIYVVEVPYLQSPSLGQLMDRVPALTNLRFLFLQSHLPGHALQLDLDGVGASMERLQMLCLNRNFWDIDRSSGTPEFNLWPQRKVQFRGKEDFVDADFEWLARHHTW